jgi:hypothetical protein
MMRKTSRPAILAGVFRGLALTESLKYAGTVITAWVTGSPRVIFGGLLHLFQDLGAEIGWREYFLSPFTSTHASPLLASTILYGTMLMIFLHDRHRCTYGRSAASSRIGCF